MSAYRALAEAFGEVDAIKRKRQALADARLSVILEEGGFVEVVDEPPLDPRRQRRVFAAGRPDLEDGVAVWLAGQR